MTKNLLSLAIVSAVCGIGLTIGFSIVYIISDWLSDRINDWKYKIGWFKKKGK